MKKPKVTKRERKAQGRNFVWNQTRVSAAVVSYGVAAGEYLGATGSTINAAVPFIRIG